MATSCHGSCTNRAFQGKALTHLRISNNKSGILIFGFPPAVPEQPYDDTHMWESTSLHCFSHLLFIPTLSLLSFSLHFLFDTFPVSAAHLVPAVTFIFLCIPLLSKEHSCTPFLEALWILILFSPALPHPQKDLACHTCPG